MNDTKNIIDVDGFKLSYLIKGEGYPVLCIGSALFYSRVFSNNLKKELKIIFIDHCGFAPPPDRNVHNSEYSLDNLIRHIEIIRNKLKLDRFFILGHSGHAFMALEYAKRYTEHVLGTIMVGVSPDYSEKTHQQTENFFNTTASENRKSFYGNKMSRLSNLIQKAPDKRFVHFCLCSGARNWYKYDFDASCFWEGVDTNMQMIDYVWGTVFKDIKITEGLDEYKISTILMLGKYDYVTGPANLWDDVKCNFHDLEIKIFEESGHYPMYEQEKLFDYELISWIKKKHHISGNHTQFER